MDMTRVMGQWAVILGLAMCGAARGQEKPTAGGLLTEVKESQDWLAKIKTWHVVYEAEQLTIRSDQAAAKSMVETATTAPASHAELFDCETAFDATRFYTRAPLNFGSLVVFFDGKVAGMSQREGAFEVTDLTDAMKQSFTRGQTYGRNGQNYWWQVERNAKQHDFMGPNAAMMNGAAKRVFHGVDCYVLWDLRQENMCYVGVADHRLYGQSRSLGPNPGGEEIVITEWYSDYKEVAAKCWYPMTIGHDEMVPAGGPLQHPIDTDRTILRVKEIAIDKPLPEELFSRAIPDGAHVHDTSGGVRRDYVFQWQRTAEEKTEIEANGARQKLFAPPAHVPGTSVVLGEKLDPLPLNPLALAPAADFPAGAKWAGGEAKKLADLKGKVVLLYFWASWQDFAEGMLGPRVPDFVVPEALKGDVVVVGVHVPTTDRARVEKAMREHHMAFTVCVDEAVPKMGWGVMGEKYRVDELPVTYVIDQEGKVAALGKFGEGLQRAGELLGKPLAPLTRPAGREVP
ncbi:MAG TPA: redoxin domain-containing protein [Phycisphaerae bacterium]|jgi:peroxiredoxin